MAVRLTNSQRKVRVPTGELKRAAEKTLTLLGLKGAELSLLVCGDTRMRALNRDYRGIDRTTDVLSFPAFDGGPDEVRRAVKADVSAGASSGPDGGPPVTLGDVVISASKARVQAAERGHSLMDEMLFLLVHGILHLAGYDHEKGPDAARAMTRKTGSIVRRLGEKS